MKKIEKYEIIEEIGRGGMGIVYKALHPFLNRYVAIKVLPEHFINEKEFVERFTNEAKTIINLKHSNIVRLYDAGIFNNNYYIVMDYIEGKTLKDFLKINKKFDINEAIDIIIQIAKALSYTHSKGVIHRDIKPSNIIIEDETKQPYLCDFGIAKAAYGTKLTLTGISIGTPEYMSTEQCKGVEVDHRTDIYSLGIIFYEMLTGRVPFEGDTPLGVAYKHVNEIPTKPRIFNPQISPYLEKIIMKMIAKDLNERYSSMDEVIEDLILFKEGKFEKIKANEFEINKCILNIKTNPKNTKVYIDGEYIGTTPLENLEINFGEYNFVFISPEYKDYSKKIKLNEKIKEIFVDLEKEGVELKKKEEVFSERETLPLNALKENNFAIKDEVIPVSEKETIPLKKREIIFPSEEKTIPIKKEKVIKEKKSNKLIISIIIGICFIFVLFFGKNIFTKKPQEIQLETNFGYLTITSDPEGSEVYINGEKIGVTPILNFKKEEGQYKIELVKNGYEKISLNVELKSGENRNLNYKLNKITTQEVSKKILKIESSPQEAEVYLNDKKIGITPLNNYILSPGKYTVKITKSGYEDYVENFEINETNNEKYIKVSLKPIKNETQEKPPSATIQNGKIYITTDPPSADIFINEIYYGKTPKLIELPSGNYDLLVQKNEYISYKTKISIQSGKLQNLNISLNKTKFYAIINVYTIPSDAEIYINDTFIGKSPIYNFNVTQQTFILTIKKENYMLYKTEVTIENGQERSFLIELAPLN